LIAIGGPTAAGKTQIAIDVARALNAEVISADSRQFYDRMRIGTARPADAELQGVPHHLLGFLRPDERFSAGQFAETALDIAHGIFQRTHTAIVVGGSGLYLSALLDGIDDLPSNPDIRAQLTEALNQHGPEALINRLKESDPVYAQTADLSNPVRVIRALEVISITGKPYSVQRTGQTRTLPWPVFRFRIALPRQQLYARINQRTDVMMQSGLLDEVKSLMPLRHANALQTVGYKELFAYLDGAYSLEEAVNKIKQHTRNYAKRQETWFRNQGSWMPVLNAEEVISAVRS
jgi:tRNA dimethylallyltransferase